MGQAQLDILARLLSTAGFYALLCFDSNSHGSLRFVFMAIAIVASSSVPQHRPQWAGFVFFSRWLVALGSLAMLAVSLLFMPQMPPELRWMTLLQVVFFASVSLLAIAQALDASRSPPASGLTMKWAGVLGYGLSFSLFGAFAIFSNSDKFPHDFFFWLGCLSLPVGATIMVFVFRIRVTPPEIVRPS